MQETGLTIENLVLSCIATGDTFKITALRSRITVDERLFVLLEGGYNRFPDGEFTVYAVVTEDRRVGMWRFVHIMQPEADAGFFFLAHQSRPPMFTLSQTNDERVAVQLSCFEKHAFFRRDVLRPYNLPIAAGLPVSGRMVQKIGEPLYHGDNNSALVPVHYEQGGYGFVECEGVMAKPFRFRSSEVADLIAHSARMPTIRHGMAQSVWHIRAYDGTDMVMIKSYYNEKSSRPDEILR